MEFGRRALLGTGLGTGVALGLAAAARPAVAAPPSRVLNAADFGAVGDGRADDTAALQKALDRSFADGGTVLMIPPGTYRVTRTLRIAFEPSRTGNLGRRSGIIGHGARLNSEIADSGNVLELLCRATVRFVVIEGLDILGKGRERHGIYVECDGGGVYLTMAS